jgi:hypothetical protein
MTQTSLKTVFLRWLCALLLAFEGFFKRSSLQENEKTGLSMFFIIVITGMTTFCISNAISEALLKRSKKKTHVPSDCTTNPTPVFLKNF